MKKIFAIALAAVMVLSLGTAFASTWGNNGANTDTAAAVSISVTKYTILEDAAGASYYSQLDDAAIVKAGDDVAFQVKIVVPSAGSLNNQFGSTVFDAGDKLAVKIDGTNLTSGADISFGTLTITLTDSSETYYLQKAVGSTTPTIVDTAAMYLDTAAEYGAVALKVNVKFVSELNEIAIKYGDYKFYVTSTDISASTLGGTSSGTVYSVYSPTYRDGAYVHFLVDNSSTTEVTAIYVEVDGCIMKVVKTDGVYQCNTTAYSGTYYASSKYAGDDFLNVVLSVLGFSAYDALYSGSVYMDPTNWAQNYGVYFNNSNNATYAAYTYVPVTATVTTTTTIPKTGSSASVIGFAMVALAVVAAAVVAVRKVRA